jgi:spermidine synthase
MSNQELHSGGIQAGLLTVLALLSGCCALAYEVLYVRALTSILGDMFYVHAALLSTFLIGIGLGAKLAHRWFRWLWAFETLTGLYALWLPIALRWLSQQLALSLITSSSLLTIVSTVGLILIPSVLIGFSIPLFSAYIKAHSRDCLAFQKIYKVYNLGAFLSILGVELILVRRFGVSLSLAIVGAINLLNGIVLLLVRAAPTDLLSPRTKRFPKRIIVALALASLSSAVFQMFFFKLTYLVFYPHRENFAIGLAITMLGLFLGTWLASKVRIRFETFLVLVPVLIGLIYANYMPILRFFEKTAPWARSSELLILLHKFAIGCLFAVGPILLFGATIPALMRSEGEVAGESGHLLWISSLANAAGYLMYVLIGHPFLTNAILLALIAGITLLASLLAAGFLWSRVQMGLAVVGVALVVLLVFNWREQNFYLAHWVNTLKSSDEVTVFKSGAESATLVRSSGTEWISYNGHPSIYVTHGGKINYAEIISGVIPALSAPRFDRALVLGLGTGMTAGATARIFTTTDVAEINNAFYKMMPQISYANLDIGRNSSANLYLCDGRAFLVGKDGTYDAIINSIPAPTYFSASKIYTVEFYERVAKALKADGVFCTWLSAGNMSNAGIQTILSALKHSFRYCDLRVMRRGYYMATCSNSPFRLRRFSELPAQPGLIRQLKVTLSGFDLDEFFEDIRISENLFEHFIPRVPQENTDDHPVLEFMVVRSYQLRKMEQDPFLNSQALFNIDPVRRHELGDYARLARRAGVFRVLAADYFDKNFTPMLKGNRELFAEYKFWSAKYVITLGESNAAIGHYTDALLLKPNWVEASNNLAWILATVEDEKLRNPVKAVQLAERACELTDHKQPEVLDTLSVAYAAMGRFSDARKTAEQAIEMARKAKKEKLVEEIQSRLELYKANKIYRD